MGFCFFFENASSKWIVVIFPEQHLSMKPCVQCKRQARVYSCNYFSVSVVYFIVFLQYENLTNLENHIHSHLIEINLMDDRNGASRFSLRTKEAKDLSVTLTFKLT